MPSSSPERGRARSRQHNSAFAKSQTPSRTRSAPRRTISPRSRSRSRTPSRTPSGHGDRRNGVRYRKGRSRSPTRTASRSRSGGRAGRRYRERSYTRSLSRGSPLPKSSKVAGQTRSWLVLLLNIHRSWSRSLQKTSMKAIYERFLEHMAPSGSLTYQ